MPNTEDSKTSGLRVAIVNQFYTPDISPTAHFAASLAEHLASRGDEVTVVTSQGGYVHASRYERRSHDRVNPRIHRAWTPRLGKNRKRTRLIDYGCFYFLAAWRALRLPRQDVFICMTTPPFIAWVAVFHQWLHPRTRIVLWNMDCYPEAAERFGIIKPGGILSRMMRWQNCRLFAHLDQLVCLDTATADLLDEYLPLANTRNQNRPEVAVIPSWEKASLFPLERPPEPPPTPEFAALRDRFVILYLGNAGTGHEFGSVLQAAERLAESDAVFLFVGGGSRTAEIEHVRVDRTLRNIVIHGYVQREQTPALMSMASCALITLSNQALGVMSPSKLHANLAMGLPIIYVGPSGSNVDDAIAKYNCGASLRHGDIDGIAATINNMAQHPEQLAEYSHNARIAFEDAFCDSVTLPKFTQILDNLFVTG